MVKKAKSNHILRKVLAGVGIALAVAIVIFAGYFMYSYYNSIAADHTQLEKAKLSDSYSYKDTKNYIGLIPKKPDGTGIIVYPGAFAEPEGYAAVFRNIAESGAMVFIVKSPLNFALLNTNAATAIINQTPGISRWYVAGHSLGGVAACEFAKSHQASIKGLILLASYCNGSANNIDVPVLSISATNDGLTTTEDVSKSRNKLPATARFVVIDGGNHTQFGAFQKLQPGDKRANIPQAAQTDQITSAILSFTK